MRPISILIPIQIIFRHRKSLSTTRTLPKGFSSSDFRAGLLESCFGSWAEAAEGDAAAAAAGAAGTAEAADANGVADTAGGCLSNSLKGLTFPDDSLPQAWKTNSWGWFVQSEIWCAWLCSD